MNKGIYNLIDCSLIQQLKFETVCNNLANVNTSGFKKNIVAFDQALSQSYIAATDYKAGPIEYTGNDLDVALEGDGFFQVQTANGVRYTRSGAFSMNIEGHLVTRAGDAVLGQSGPIKIAGGKVSIATDGQVMVEGNPVDTINVVDFKDRILLQKEGHSYYRYVGEESDISQQEKTQLTQGYLENSNVNPTQEMIKMVESFRAFESAQKAIQSIDEITSKMVNDYGLLQ